MQTLVFILGAFLANASFAEAGIGPELRPAGLMQKGIAHKPSELMPRQRPKNLQLGMSKRPKKRRGALCNVKDLQGVEITPVSGPIAGCGIKNPVRITGVAGVHLSTAATIDCKTAVALDQWVRKSAIKELKRKGGLREIRVAASYACRTRNNLKGAKMSEHSLGHAIDISGFTLKNGAKVTVLKDWPKGPYSKSLRKMHKGACGIFGTVLGPKSDRFHQDHFHFDTARYRSGAYCR